MLKGSYKQKVEEEYCDRCGPTSKNKRDCKHACTCGSDWGSEWCDLDGECYKELEEYGGDRKIIQIMPADGWSALYEVSDIHNDEPRVEPLICWALCEVDGVDGLEQQIFGMVTGDNGQAVFADYSRSATKYVRTAETTIRKYRASRN